jgi:HSP20 family molecular chaperone IbpA
MAIIRWNPWSLSSLIDDDFEVPTFPGVSRLGQGLNLYETEEEVVAEAILPGIPEDRIDVTIDDGVVRITGSSKEAQEEKTKRRYFMTSMASTYNYSFRLPEGVAGDKEPACEIQNGVLTMRFAKVQKAAPKKITVRATDKKA